MESAAKIYLSGANTAPAQEHFDFDLTLGVHMVAVVPSSFVLASIFLVIFLLAGSRIAIPFASNA